MPGAPSWFQAHQRVFWAGFIFPCGFSPGEIHGSTSAGWSSWHGGVILNQEVDSSPCECPGDSSVPVPSALQQTQGRVLQPSGLGANTGPGVGCQGKCTLRGSVGARRSAISLATQRRLGAFLQTSPGSSWCGWDVSGPGVWGSGMSLHWAVQRRVTDFVSLFCLNRGS